MSFHPKKPLSGDFIATDWLGVGRKYVQRVPFHCSRVVAVNGNNYKMSYDDNWYCFENFGEPKVDNHGVCLIYPLIPLDITDTEYKKLNTGGLNGNS